MKVTLKRMRSEIEAIIQSWILAKVDSPYGRIHYCMNIVVTNSITSLEISINLWDEVRNIYLS